MAQQHVITDLNGDNGKKQMVTGTVWMRGSTPPTHTREMSVGVPHFASRPDITVSLWSDDGEDTIDTDLPVEETEWDKNPGTTFAAWAIVWNRRGEVGGLDQIAVTATRTDGAETPTKVRVFCSYVAIGDPA